MNHNVKSAFVKHFGWFNGNAATLHPLPRVPAGTRYVEYMGGADAIIERAPTNNLHIRQRRARGGVCISVQPKTSARE
jgi:alkyl sulfatase BDS1-like metallo-beta-lactamase superfamily hydrolase